MNLVKCATLLISTAILTFSSLASNAGIRTGWSMNAMACTPTEETARKNNMIQVAGKVKFKGQATGKITLICPVTSGILIPETKHGSQFTIKQVQLTYKDGDAGAVNGGVSVTFRAVNKKTGHVKDLEKFSSNSRGAPNSGPKGFATYGEPVLNTGKPNHGLNHNLSFQKNFYYLQITIERKNPKVPVSVMGVSLLLG